MTTTTSQLREPEDEDETNISLLPPALKFVVSNLKSLVHVQLDAENYQIWRAQILKIFQANRFDKYLDLSSTYNNATSQSAESQSSVPTATHFNFIDRNLSTALCATITPSILPYVVHLQSTAQIWHTLETRFQSSNRSKVIQLKNSLHNISLRNQSISQYLTEIKSLVDQIASSGSTVDTEDVILYILNGLPATYQSFKTAIRTMLTPISLDQLYALLLSEEVNIAADLLRQPSDPTTALFTSRGRGRRSR
ncbi:uncharacterized protein LOC114578883 [Dendrobium catenatum]|uniref:uncharacterized protein LOC114578883 n=1 Tax=Dendrobium catenatum TaxID=906689 RepID=UPI00109F8084|nr:uncharacterized protein LOC114578883 [Dendrobium catenatum]